MKRIELLKPYIQEKSVLDLGCVDHTWQQSGGEKWLHKHIKKYSSELVGLDYLEEDVQKLQDAGYNVIHGNAEDFDLNRTFDVIVAGELIEHLSNVGSFLQSVKLHMHDESVFILTTPNAFALGNIFRITQLFLGVEMKDNDEHSQWYDMQTLRQVLHRHGLEVIASRTFYPERYNEVWDSIVPIRVRAKLFVAVKKAR